MKHIEQIDFYGLKLSLFSKLELIQRIIDVILNNEKIICYGYSLGTIYLMKKSPEIYTYGNQADILVTDGRLLYLFAKILNFPLRCDISIPNLVKLLLEFANEHKLSVFLLGADKETNSNAVRNLRLAYPNIIVPDGIDGYFKHEEENDIIARINRVSPDIVLIGISSPIKERLAFTWKDRLNTKIIVPCGGMIDVFAGKTKQSPNLIKKLGLASVYRIIQEPKRILKRNLKIYYYVFFKFLPIFFLKVILKRDKNFSIPEFLNIN